MVECLFLPWRTGKGEASISHSFRLEQRCGKKAEQTQNGKGRWKRGQSLLAQCSTQKTLPPPPPAPQVLLDSVVLFLALVLQPEDPLLEPGDDLPAEGHHLSTVTHQGSACWAPS